MTVSLFCLCPRAVCLAYSSVLGSQSAVPWLPGTILFRSFENNGIPISERTPLYSGLTKWPPVKLTKWCVHMWILGRRHPIWQRNTYFYFYNPTVSYIFLAAAWLQKSLSFLHFADTRLCFPSLKHILTRDLIYTVPRATHPARQFWVSQYVVNLDLLAPTLGDSGEPITHFWTLSVASWMSPRYTTYALILETPLVTVWWLISLIVYLPPFWLTVSPGPTMFQRNELQVAWGSSWKANTREQEGQLPTVNTKTTKKQKAKKDLMRVWNSTMAHSAKGRPLATKWVRGRKLL